jgi:1,4-dihydroxy-6-naphthoate synthase
MTLSLAFSPCPNDTFIFDALVHHKIDTAGLDFSVSYLDVQQLNLDAAIGKYDITKLSYFAASRLLDQYQILSSGGALGFGCGPLLISKKNYALEEVRDLKIAIPGKNTTANFLLQYALPGGLHTEEYLFSDIENAVLEGKVDAGLIIHENRFTYENKGLQKIVDLGEYWEKQTGHPIPLGCIAVRRSMGDGLKNQLNNLIRSSVGYAWQLPGSGRDYIKCHSQELEDSVIDAHINLYVNAYSADLGPTGKKAVLHMFERAGVPREFLNEKRVFV